MPVLHHALSFVSVWSAPQLSDIIITYPCMHANLSIRFNFLIFFFRESNIVFFLFGQTMRSSERVQAYIVGVFKSYNTQTNPYIS